MNLTLEIPCFFLQHMWSQTPFHDLGFLLLAEVVASIWK